MRQIEWARAEESDLVSAAQAGDLGAFDQLARCYRPAAILVASRLVGREPAEDVVQDALLAAYKALPQLRDRQRFGAWMLAIVRHRAARVLAGTRTEPEPLSDHLDRLILRAAPSIGSGPTDADEASEAIRKLPGTLTEIAELYYLQDWPISRIAETLSLTETTIKWRLHTVRQRLRRTLDPCSEN